MTPERSIAHYRLTDKIGAGGMGEVWRAQDTKLGREVAVKLLPDAFARDSERMARFQREAQVLASLNHPNIAAIYGVEDRALIMELVDGPTLEERIARGAIPLDEALPLVHQLIDALEYAHEKNVVHRDLKPANIKLTPEGRVKVLDFGLAKAMGAEVPPGDPASSPTLTMRSTLAGVILGTAAYMSPEQARGQNADKRADVWAFGVVLYEMLTGRQLFGGPTISDTLASVLKEEPPLGQIPPRMRRVVSACLVKDPRLRLRDIGSARLLLDASDEAQHAPSRLPWVLAAAGILLAAGGWFAVWRGAAPSRDLMQFNIDLGPDSIAGFRTTAAPSPDGTRIVFQSRDSDGRLRLSTRLLSQPVATPLAGTENGSEPFYSPDGKWIGFFANNSMKKVALSGGPAVTLCNAERVLGAAWDTNGTIIASLGISGGLFRVPAAGGSPVPITNPSERGEMTHRWPQLLPGGQTVLFTSHRTANSFDAADVDVLSLKSGQWKTVVRNAYYGRYLPSGHLVYVNQGSLFAAPFDPQTGTLKASPTPVLDDLAGNTTVGGGQFDFSSTGMFVYLRGKPTDATVSLAWADPSGKIDQLLSSASIYDISISPDGTKVAMSSGALPSVDLTVVDVQSKNQTKITFNGQQNRHPIWTPDGKHIVYVSQASATAGLWWVRQDGASEPRQILNTKETIFPDSFSPDGRRLAYTIASGDTSFDIWTLPLDLSDPEKPKALTAEPFLRTRAGEMDGMFSPNGRWLAYTSTESGASEVYVRPFRPNGEGSGGKWQISTHGGTLPVWSRDGRTLMYQAPDDRLMVVDCDSQGEAFMPKNDRAWTENPIEAIGLRSGFFRTLDLSPDGRRALVVVRQREAAKNQWYGNQVVVMLNFFDELRKRVPVR